MMKNESTVKRHILVVQAEDLVAQYRSSVMEHLYTDMDSGYTHVKDFALDLRQLSTELLNMLDEDGDTAYRQFREMFKGGSTMMMMPCNDFEQVENWVHKEEPFQIVVLRENGTPVGAFKGEDVNY